MKYELLSFDETLLTFDVQTNSNPGRVREITIVFAGDRNLFPAALQYPGNIALERRLDMWLSNRITMIGQRLARKIRKQYGMRTSLQILEVTYGLSLTDAFWIRREGDDCRWDQVNLYSNDFRELEGVVLVGENVDYLHGRCLSPDFTTDGRMRKSWVRDKRGIFLLKSDMREGLFSQSTNEWFASQAAEVFGVPHVSYNLRVYGKNSFLASECPIFTSENRGFINTYQYLLRKGWEESSLRIDVLSEMPVQEAVCREVGQKFYEDMMVFDFLIGNIDRHLGNFGFLIDNHTGNIIGTAPLFDHGKSFFADEPVIPQDPENWASYEAQISTFLAPEEHMAFIRPRHKEHIQHLLEYKFRQHPLFPISDHELELVTRFCRFQCLRALEHLKK